MQMNIFCVYEAISSCKFFFFFFNLLKTQNCHHQLCELHFICWNESLILLYLQFMSKDYRLIV